LIEIHQWANELEAILIPQLRPYFFTIQIEDNPLSLHIIISSRQFDNKTVNERIQLVLDLITFHGSDILRFNVVIEPFTAFEIEEILDNL
jgi:hypothetical protein